MGVSPGTLGIEQRPKCDYANMKDSMMWPQFLLLFLTVGLAAGCDEDACNIGILLLSGLPKHVQLLVV